MPDAAMHHVFGMDVRKSLPPQIREELMDCPYTFALYGPDPWFMYHPWKSRHQGRGRRMHTTRTGAFLSALVLRARDGSAPQETFSYLAGFLCHYALDSVTHPYIIWQTTETWPTKRAHRDLEHALDILLLRREGSWEEKHPITDRHFPKLHLPESMAADLDAVYGQVYGWGDVLPAVNQCYQIYRWVFRQMEKKRSPLTLAASLSPTPGMCSLPHAKCAFLDRDVENLSHTPWQNPFTRQETFTDSFPDLYEQARQDAVRMITACWSFTRQGNESEADLARVLGNRSYFSGLDAEDPRNNAIPGLRPPRE